MEKKPIKKNRIKEFGGRNAPEASQGKIRDVPGTPGTFGPLYVEIPIQGSRGRMSAGQTGHMTGQMGHVHGTDGTHTRVCPAKILYVYRLFFPQFYWPCRSLHSTMHAFTFPYTGGGQVAQGDCAAGKGAPIENSGFCKPLFWRAHSTILTEMFTRQSPQNLVARAIRANRFARIIRNCNPYFYSVSGRFAPIT